MNILTLKINPHLRIRFDGFIEYMSDMMINLTIKPIGWLNHLYDIRFPHPRCQQEVIMLYAITFVRSKGSSANVSPTISFHAGDLVSKAIILFTTE